MQTTIDIQVGNLTRSVPIPEGWNDLSLKTLLLFYNTLFTTPGDEYSASAFTMVKLITMAQQVLRIDMDQMAKWEADCMKDPNIDPESGVTGELIFLSELREVLHAALSGLFSIETDDDGVTRYSVQYNLTKNPYPSLTSAPPVKKGQRPKKLNFLYAPAEGLGNITIYELGKNFTLFENYIKTNDDTQAEQLLAVLYRPSRPMTKLEVANGWKGGDRRQPLRNYESKIDERAELIRTLPPLTKRILLFWFASCRHAIVESYPKVFKQSTGTEKPGYGWGGVLLSIAGGPTGLDIIADQHYGNALTWLSMKEDEAVDRRIG